MPDVPCMPDASDTHVRNPGGALAKLPPKRQAFVLAYCRPTTRAKDLGNATAAARAAGYSPTTAMETGHKLKNDPRVRAAIEEEKAALRNEHAMLARRALAELEAAALANLPDLVHWVQIPVFNREGVQTGTRTAMQLRDDVPPEAWAAVQEIADSADGGLRVKLAGKAQLLALLLKATGFVEDRGPTVGVAVSVNGEPRAPADTGITFADLGRVRAALGFPTPQALPPGGEA